MGTWIGIGIVVVLIALVGHFSNKNRRFDHTYNQNFEMEKERTRQSSMMFQDGNGPF